MAAYWLVAAMSVFGTSRFTALIAAIALSGTAGTFWWALETRSDMKAAAGGRIVNRAVPLKAGGRAPRFKDERSAKLETKFDGGKSETGKFELMGKSAGVRNDDPDRPLDRSIPSRLINYPASAINYPNPGQGPAPGQGTSRVSQNGRADMPLPAMPARTEPVAMPAPMPWHPKAPDPPLAFAAPAPAPPPPAESPRRLTRESRPEPPIAATAGARAPRAQSFYTEQFIEQGEFRYRRRPCEPPNMPDVCFMPQADRHPIVVAKP